ncbi:hypothetical protein CICLE_v10003902mg, partial [Citrus x clementina]
SERSTSKAPPAHYIVKIKSFSLLAEKAEEEYESGEFEVGGYKWYSKNVKDYISLYLAIAGTSSFTLDWENQDNYFVVQDCMGKERRFNGLKHVWGFDKFIPLRAFNDALNGYLVEDTCVFDAEVLVKERNKFKGECLSMKEIASSCKYVWKIEKFSKLDAGYEESQVFDARNHKWYQSKI